MDYDSFKQKAKWNNLTDTMKIAFTLYFLDKNNKGFSFSELTDKLKSFADEEKIDSGIDRLLDKGEIYAEYGKRGDLMINLYTLDTSFRNTLDDLTKYISESK